MCGIAGWISYDSNVEAHQDIIAKMTKTMARRGPDAEGVWIEQLASRSCGSRARAISRWVTDYGVVLDL